ncbi:hypothetical protein SAMN05216525_14720 [Bradyrhizobium sp. Gha]|nr:hypothetical protein SAMN05216525_14720 [Bradyrhizobium sp. Gha]
MSGTDPGRVETQRCWYDSLVILRGELMRRFVAGADRGQWTLLPECLDDFIDESNPVRLIDIFVDALELAEMGFEGWSRRRPAGRRTTPEALHLWLSEPGAIDPAARTRGRAQCRGDVAAGSACSRPQDDRRLPQGQRPGASQRISCFAQDRGRDHSRPHPLHAELRPSIKCSPSSKPPPVAACRIPESWWRLLPSTA